MKFSIDLHVLASYIPDLATPDAEVGYPSSNLYSQNARKIIGAKVRGPIRGPICFVSSQRINDPTVGDCTFFEV